MKEIKFRAWDKKLKFMYPDAFDHPDYVFEDMMVMEEQFVLMQCTGQKGQNKKEMYRDDIISFYDNNSLQVIIWYDEWCGFACKSIKDGFISNMPANPEQFIIHGNIHENPELMEQR